jgi:hypothetical protein
MFVVAAALLVAVGAGSATWTLRSSNVAVRTARVAETVVAAEKVAPPTEKAAYTEKAVVVDPPPAPAEKPPAVPGKVAAPAIASASAPGVPSDRTLVIPPASSKGHRIYVDGHVIGNGPAPFKTKCGNHKLQFGSHGRPHMTDLPCGSRLTID